MARTVLGDSPNCFATRRTAALSHARPTASSKRLLKGALLGNCGTFSVFTPQSGQRTRYSSITTVVRNSKQGRSRTSRSYVSYTSLSFRPQPEHTSLRFPRFRRTHNFSVLASSLISWRYTRYPGQPRIFVQSVSRILGSVIRVDENRNPHLIGMGYTFLLRAVNLCAVSNMVLQSRVTASFRPPPPASPKGTVRHPLYCPPHGCQRPGS